MSESIPTFEQAHAELERVLRDLEDGTITLDESLAKYERGIKLIRYCSGHLTQAELKVKLLTGVNAEGQPELAPLAHEASVERAIKKTRKDQS